MALVYSYLRFSTKKQQHGDSHRRQREMGLSWIKSNGHQEATLIQDRGVSSFRGQNKHHGALSQFLQAIKAGKIQPGSILLVEHLDRLSRQGVDEAHDLFKKILKAGVDIVCLKPEPKRYSVSDLDDFLALLMPLIHFNNAHLESKNKSQRVKAYWQKIRSTGQVANSHCPSWLDWDGKQFVPNDGVEAIRYMFQLASEGKGQKQILQALQDKFPPIGTSGKWVASYISKTLSERAVLGEMTFRLPDDNGKRKPTGDVIQGYYPQIIDEELWNKVYLERKKRLRHKGPDAGYVNIFRGLVINANDRSAMHHIRSQSQTGYLQRRFQSYKQQQKAKGADSASIDMFEFEKGFLIYLRELSVSDLYPKNDQVDKQKDDVTKQLSAITSQIQAIENELENPENTKIISALAKSLNTLTTKKEIIEEELAKIKSMRRVDDLHDMTSLAIKVSELPDDSEERHKLRSLLHDVVKTIWIKPERHHYKIYWIAQIVFTSGAIRYLVGGNKIENVWSYANNQGNLILDTSPVNVYLCDEMPKVLDGLDLSDESIDWKNTHLLKPLADLANDDRLPFDLPEQLPDDYDQAIDCFVRWSKSLQAKDSARMIPSQLARFTKYHRLSRRVDFDKAAIILDRYGKHLTKHVKNNKVALLTARASYRRARQFLDWWGCDVSSSPNGNAAVVVEG